MTKHRVGTREEWEAERDVLLAAEKEQTRRGDELAERRRELPWVPVEKEYSFATEDGTKSLADMFDGRSQLLVYFFMFGPSYEAGCPTNSSMADSFDGVIPHLRARDANMICVSRAPIEKLAAYKRRMGWSFEWASSADSDFNFDFGVSMTDAQVREQLEPMVDDLPPIARQNAEATGTDVLSYIAEGWGFGTFVAADDDSIYHAYSTTERGVEFLMGYYPILDHAPKGRDEEGELFQTWLRRHDEYEHARE
jgi:predicted dithiol-disulfide oxidoreductase (DUF899 family)